PTRALRRTADMRLALLASVLLLAACGHGDDVRHSPAPAGPVTHAPPTAVPPPPGATPPPVGERLVLSDAEWRRRLTPRQYEVLREQDTEAAFSGEYWNEHDRGVYYCAACGAPLFSSTAKFDSGTGWPSFWQPIEAGRVETREDDTLGMTRNEVHCARC